MSSPGHPPRLQLALPSSTTSFKRSFEQFGFELDDSSPGSATNQVEHGGAVGTASAVGPSSSGLGHSRSGIMDGTTSFGGTGSGFGFNNGSNSYGRGATLGRQDRNKRARSDTSERSPSSFSASLSSVRDGRVSALSATASLSTSVSESDEGEESFTTAHTSLNLSPIEGVSPIRISGLFEPSARLVNVQAEDVNEHREDRAQDVDMHDVLESPPSPTLPQAQVQRLPATPSPPPAPTTLPTRSLLSALPFHEPPTSPAPSQSLESSRASSSARPIPPRINTFERWATDRFRSAATPSPTTAVSINTETRGLPEQDFFGPGSLGRMTPPWLRRALPSVDTSGPNLLDVIDQASSVASDSSSVDMERVSSDPGSQQSSHSHSFLTDVISHNFQRGDTSSASSPSRRPLPRTPLELPAPSSSTAPMPSPSLLTPSTLAARRYIESPLLPLPPAPGMGASVTWAYDDSLGEWWHRAAGTPDAGESSSQEARGPMPRIRRQEFLQLAPSPSPTRLRFGLMSPADRTGRSGTGAVSGSENGGPLDSPRELQSAGLNGSLRSQRSSRLRPTASDVFPESSSTPATVDSPLMPSSRFPSLPSPRRNARFAEGHRDRERERPSSFVGMPSRHWASRLGDDSETLVGSSSRLRSPRMRQRSPYSHGADLPSGSLRALLTTDRLPESFSTPGMSGRSGAVAGPSNATPSMPSSASLPTNAQAAINEGMAGVRALLREDSSDSSMDSAQNPFINRPQNITNPIADQSNSSASASPSSEEDSSAEYVLVGRDIAREQAPAQPQRAASPEASLPPRAIQRILRPVERYPGRVPTVPGYGSFSEGSSDDEPWGRGADLLREQLHGRVRDHLPDESANAMQVDDESANVGSLDRDANPTTLFPPSDSLPSTSESARRRSRTEGAFPLDLDLTGFDPSFERDIEQVLRPPSRPRSPLIHPSSSSNTRVGSRPHIFHSSSSSTSNVTREQGRRGVFEFLRDAPTSLFSLPPVEPSHVDSDREGMSEEGTQAQGALNMFDRPLLRRRSSLGGLSPGPSGLSSSPETSSRIPRSYSPDQDSITLAQRRLQSAREARESREASRRPGSSSRQVLDVLPRTTAQRRIEERRLALEFDRSERLRASESRERSERRVGGTRDQDRVWPNPTHGRPELLSPVHHQRSASTAAALREPVYGDIPTAAHENNRRRARMRMREALAERMRRAVDEDRSGRSPATWNRSREENLPIFGSGSVASASSSSSSNAPSLPPLEFGPGRSRDPSPMRPFSRSQHTDEPDSDRAHSRPPWATMTSGGLAGSSSSASASASQPSTYDATVRNLIQMEGRRPPLDTRSDMPPPRSSSLHQALRRREANRHGPEAEGSTSRSPTRFGEARAAVSDVFSRALRTGVSSLGTPRTEVGREEREAQHPTSSRWGEMIDPSPTEYSERRRRRLLSRDADPLNRDAGTSSSIQRARMNSFFGRINGERGPIGSLESDGTPMPRSYTSMEELYTALESRRDFSMFTNRRRDPTTLGDFIRDEDFDDSYDNLLRLQAIMGEVKARGTPDDVIDRLPTSTFREWSVTGTDTRCPICLDDYLPDDEMQRIEGCEHWFHKACLGQWLHGARTCPVCRTSVKRSRPKANANHAGPSSSNDPGPSNGGSGNTPSIPGSFMWTFGPASPFS